MSKRDYDESMNLLRDHFKPGDTAWTKLNHVSRSGMQREIAVIGIQNNDPSWYSWHVANVLGRRQGKQDGVIVNGCGMDMGFALVYELSHRLYPDGFDCIGYGCPSNDHSNRENNQHHKDGGYALRQRWL